MNFSDKATTRSSVSLKSREVMIDLSALGKGNHYFIVIPESLLKISALKAATKKYIFFLSMQYSGMDRLSRCL